MQLKKYLRRSFLRKFFIVLLGPSMMILYQKKLEKNSFLGFNEFDEK
jgi:hypothetical protein